MINTFFKQVIAEENAIDNEAEEIRKKVKLLEDEITRLKSGNSYYQRKYCKFSDGYNCKFTGICTRYASDGEIVLLLIATMWGIVSPLILILRYSEYLPKLECIKDEVEP